MKMKKVTRLVAAATIVFLCIAGWHSISAYSVYSSGSLSIEADETQVILDTTADDFAISISIDSGEAQVESVSGGTTTVLGTVYANQSCVFEGSYSDIQIQAIDAEVTGSYEIKELDTTVGDAVLGSVEVTLSGSAVRVYKGSSSNERGIHVAVTSGTIGIRTSSTGSDIVTITAGDSAVVTDTTSEFWLSGTGSVTAEPEKPSSTSTWSEWHKCSGNSNGDIDTLDSNSTTSCYDYEVKNTGGVNDGKVTIKKRHKDGQYKDETFDLDPGDSSTFNCTWKEVSATFEKSGGKVEWRKKKNS